MTTETINIRIEKTTNEDGSVLAFIYDSDGVLAHEIEEDNEFNANVEIVAAMSELI